MPAFPKPTATETDPVASPAVSVEAAARADADALLAPKASPAFTGNPTAPTQSAGNNSTRLATTAYADAAASSAAATKAAGTKAWATATAYIQGQMVTNGGFTYIANDAHTSGVTFAGDLGSHWTLLPVGATDTAVVSKSIMDAKGDLLTATADNTPARKAVGVNTRVLAADSTQSDGLAWVDAQPVIPTPVAGGYYPWTFANAAQVNAEGIIMFCPVILPPGTIDRIVMSVLTTPGSAGSVHRLGLYTQRAGSRFGTMDLLVDAGTVATTSTGDKAATVSVTLTVPTLAFIACVQQGAPTTRAAVRSGGTNVPSQIGSGATGLWHNGLGGMRHVGGFVPGALPSTAVGTLEFNLPHWGVVRYV